MPNGANFDTSPHELLVVFIKYLIRIINLNVLYSNFLCVLVVVITIIVKGKNKRCEMVVTI